MIPKGLKDGPYGQKGGKGVRQIARPRVNFRVLADTPGESAQTESEELPQDSLQSQVSTTDAGRLDAPVGAALGQGGSETPGQIQGRENYHGDTTRFDYLPSQDEPFQYGNLASVGENPESPAPDDFGALEDLIREEDALARALREYIQSDLEHGEQVDGSALGLRSSVEDEYVPEQIGFRHLGSPEEILQKLERAGYICQPFIASQIALLLRTELNTISSIMLEGPSGCGKSFLAKSLAKISGAELMVLQCYREMSIQHLIEKPSEFAALRAMAGKEVTQEESVELGIISRAFLKSQEKPVILLVDEIDKADWGIDTFFLGPIQDGIIHLQSRSSIAARLDNLLIIFTKNLERPLNDALLRRVQPVSMEYMKPELEEKVLSPHCVPRLVQNLVRVAAIMRHADEAYRFERPPAPEELLKTGKYITQLLKWHITDYAFIGKNIWYMLAKSEKDRETLERLLRYHPDFHDSSVPNNRTATLYQIFSRLGKVILDGLIEDPRASRIAAAYVPEKIGLTDLGTPEELADKLEKVGYQCLPFVSSQIALLAGTPSDKVRALLLEGPSGCGKTYMAKSLAKVCGAELMCMSCYEGMNTAHLLEYPSTVAMVRAQSKSSGSKPPRQEELISLGIISRAFLKSQSHPVILLVDELDKVESGVDTFFLGPLQDGTIWLESRPPVDANIDNLLVIFTKNMNRTLDQALLRRLHPIRLTYLDSSLEKKILSKHCIPQLVENLVAVADLMRDSNGSFQFERPPAPEELLTCGHYISKLLEWGHGDFSFIGKSVWAIIAKSERDRAVLEHMMRFHPDFEDPLFPDAKNTPLKEIHARLGRWVLRGIVRDPLEEKRREAWKSFTYD